MHRPFVECENVSKSFGGNVVLDSLNMRIEKNEVISVIGPVALVNRHYFVC